MRWARQHIYSWLVLAPLVLGLTYFTIVRVAGNLPPWQPSRSFAIAMAALFETVLIGLSLSRASAELYHLRRPEAYFDALPLNTNTHLLLALAGRLGRTAVVAGAILLARSLLAESDWLSPINLLGIVLFIVITSLAEVYGALNWIHWRHTRDKTAAITSLFAILLNVILGSLLLSLIIKPEQFSFRFEYLLFAFSGLSAAFLYNLARRSHERWRTSDIEYAKRLESSSRWNVFDVRLIKRKLAPTVAAQLARDLQLTLRAFSSAVYVVILVTALWVVAMVIVLIEDLFPFAANFSIAGWLDLSWLPQSMAIKFACVLITASLASLLPLLVAYELPILWIERAVGSTGFDIWQAKLWYARIVTAPAPLIAWTAGLLTGKEPLSYAVPLLAECLFLWWLVSSIIGALSFEMPTRPGLAIIVMATVGLAAGAFTTLLWPFGILIYAQSIGALTDRGRHMARYYLMTNGD
jgi:hypothetical protein